jgi:hypothetical protein
MNIQMETLTEFIIFIDENHKDHSDVFFRGQPGDWILIFSWRMTIQIMT